MRCVNLQGTICGVTDEQNKIDRCHEEVYREKLVHEYKEYAKAGKVY